MNVRKEIEPLPGPDLGALVCDPGFVPGWLDEDGNPLGCVNNGPDPFVDVGVAAVPSVPAAELTLAATGVDPILASILAFSLIATGAWLRFRHP